MYLAASISKPIKDWVVGEQEPKRFSLGLEAAFITDIVLSILAALIGGMLILQATNVISLGLLSAMGSIGLGEGIVVVAVAGGVITNDFISILVQHVFSVPSIHKVQLRKNTPCSPAPSLPLPPSPSHLPFPFNFLTPQKNPKKNTDSIPNKPYPWIGPATVIPLLWNNQTSSKASPPLSDEELPPLPPRKDEENIPPPPLPRDEEVPPPLPPRKDEENIPPPPPHPKSNMVNSLQEQGTSSKPVPTTPKKMPKPDSDISQCLSPLFKMPTARSRLNQHIKEFKYHLERKLNSCTSEPNKPLLMDLYREKIHHQDLLGNWQENNLLNYFDKLDRWINQTSSRSIQKTRIKKALSELEKGLMQKAENHTKLAIRNTFVRKASSRKLQKSNKPDMLKLQSEKIELVLRVKKPGVTYSLRNLISFSDIKSAVKKNRIIYSIPSLQTVDHLDNLKKEVVEEADRLFRLNSKKYDLKKLEEKANELKSYIEQIDPKIIPFDNLFSTNNN